MQDVMRDPNAMVSIRFEDEDGLDNYMKTSTNVLLERVPEPGDEPEPYTKDEPETKLSGKVLGGVALGALLFWDELALIFLATR